MKGNKTEEETTMKDTKEFLELNDEELSQVSGGAKQELVKVEIYCKDCGIVIDSWQESKGMPSVGHPKVYFCTNCNSQNIGQRETPLQS